MSLQVKRLLSADERRIIAFVERTHGPQEINLSLEQAKALGEL